MMELESDEPMRGWRRAMMMAIAAGVITRLAQYLSRQSYWTDEAFLVLNIFQKSYSELLGPLSQAQASAPLFLLAQRAIYLTLGGSEYALRLVPVTLGVAALLLFAWLCWRLLRPPIAVLMTAMFALSDRMIWHAAEAKQYSGDLFVSVLLLSLAVAGATRFSAARRLLHVAAAAAVLMWFSHPVVFVFGGLALGMLPRIAHNRGRGTATFAAICGLPAASFVALYLFSIRLQQSGMLYDYWADRFVDYSQPLLIPLRLIRRTMSLFNYAFDDGGWALMPLGIIGGIVLWRSGRRELLGILALPIGLTYLAAAAHRYPYDGTRLTLFLAPMCLLLSGFGIEALATRLSDRPPQLRIALAGILLAIGGVAAIYHLVVPRYRGNMRSIVQYVREHRQPGEAIYVEREAEFRCYWPDPAPPLHLGSWPEHVPSGRFWILVSHDPGDLDDEMPTLAQQATAVRRYSVRGGTALLLPGGNGSD